MHNGSNDMASVTLFLLFTFLSFCHAQESAADDNDCKETGNCSDVTSCIFQYNQLDSYILNDMDLLRKLTETFFKTGNDPSEFVKLTYKFYVYDGGNSTDYGLVNCTSRKTTYIWSTSVLYLLGPDPLFLLTLFAVNVPEASVTIELPCFCTDSYNDLLDRLTYLVSVIYNYTANNYKTIMQLANSYTHVACYVLQVGSILRTVP